MKMHYNTHIKHDGTSTELFLPYTLILTMDLGVDDANSITRIDEYDTVETIVDYARANVSLLHADSEKLYTDWLKQKAHHREVSVERFGSATMYNARRGHLYEIMNDIVYRTEQRIAESLRFVMISELNILLRNDSQSRQQLIHDQLVYFK